jgi:hypothetical protein
MKRNVGLRTAAVTSALVGVFIAISSQRHTVVNRVATATLKPVSLPYEEVVKGLKMNATLRSAPPSVGPDDPDPPISIDPRDLSMLTEYSAKVHMMVEYPRSAFSDDSFFVRVSRLIFSEPKVLSFTVGGEVPPKEVLLPEFTQNWNEANIGFLFYRGCLGLSLSVPGAEVSPPGFVHFNGASSGS